MRVIQLVKYGDAEEAFRIAEVEKPQTGPGEVLIKVESFGLNFADVMARRGLYKAAPPIPGVLGYEVVGTIDEYGSEVKDMEKGARVVSFTRFGGYAEYVKTDAAAVFPVSGSSDSGELAALSTQYTTAHYSAYVMANIKEGECVLVHAAAGGVGIALVQLSLNRGCNVVATVGSEKKVQFLKTLGVKHVFNYLEGDFEKGIPELTGKKPDVIFDPVGGKNFKKNLNILATGGRIVGYGASDQLNRKKSFISSLKLLFGFGFHSPVKFMINTQGILGVNMLKVADDKPELLTRSMAAVVDMYNKGLIKPHVAKEFKAEEIAEAHAFLESRQSIGKIVLHW